MIDKEPKSCTIVQQWFNCYCRETIKKFSAGVILCNVRSSTGGLKLNRISQRYNNDGDNKTISFSAIMSLQQLLVSITFTILFFVSLILAANYKLYLYQPHSIYIQVLHFQSVCAHITENEHQAIRL